MKTNDKIIIGLLGIAAIAWTWQHLASAEADPAGPDGNAGTFPAPELPAAQLDYNLVLKSGMRGLEVAKLQTMLGVAADGIFGPQTENALLYLKGVRQISLAQFGTIASINHSALAIGSRVMASRHPGTQTYTNQTLANGSFYNTGNPDVHVAFGQEVGTIVAIPDDAVNYVVQLKGFLSGKVWVRATDVQKI